MRALKLWSDIIEWRWAPTVAIALGALSYVSLAVLIIPDRLGNTNGSPGLGVSALNAARSSGSLFGASVTGAVQHEASETGTSPNSAFQGAVHGSSPRPVMQSGFPRRGFTPPLPRPEPEVAPPPPAPPPPPAIVIQPPPPQPEAAAPPPVPPGAAPTAPPVPTAPSMNNPQLNTAVPGTPPPESAPTPPPPLPAAEVAPPTPPPPVP